MFQMATKLKRMWSTLRQSRRHAFEKEGAQSLKKYPPPWLGNEENFEIYKL